MQVQTLARWVLLGTLATSSACSGSVEHGTEGGGSAAYDGSAGAAPDGAGGGDSGAGATDGTCSSCGSLEQCYMDQRCDLESVDFLTMFATRSANPYSPKASSGLGAASIAALGRIHPADLRSKLDPLLSKEGVLHIKAAAEAALTGEDRCPVQRAE